MPIAFEELHKRINAACLKPTSDQMAARLRKPRQELIKLLVLEWAGIKFSPEEMVRRTDALFDAYANAQLVSNSDNGRESTKADITEMFKVITHTLGEPRPPTVTPKELLELAERACTALKFHTDAGKIKAARTSALKSLVLEWAGIDYDRSKVASRIDRLTNDYQEADLIGTGAGARSIVMKDLEKMYAIVLETLGPCPVKGSITMAG